MTPPPLPAPPPNSQKTALENAFHQNTSLEAQVATLATRLADAQQAEARLEDKRRGLQEMVTKFDFSAQAEAKAASLAQDRQEAAEDAAEKAQRQLLAAQGELEGTVCVLKVPPPLPSSDCFFISADP